MDAHPYPAAEPLLACAALCGHERQRKALETRVVLHTLDLADSVARRYRGRGVEQEDLTQVARLALVKAVRGYRSERSHGFTAYAVPTVTGEIRRYFRDHGWGVRPPRALQELRSSIAQAESALPQRLQREPTDAELAGELGVSREVLDEARSATKAYRTASLDAAPPYAVAAQLREDRDDFEELLTKDELRRALAGLSEREREILRMRFVEECSQSEIGRAIGVSQMQVSRLLSQALRTLRGTLGATEPAA